MLSEIVTKDTVIDQVFLWICFIIHIKCCDSTVCKHQQINKYFAVPKIELELFLQQHKCATLKKLVYKATKYFNRLRSVITSSNIYVHKQFLTTACRENMRLFRVRKWKSGILQLQKTVKFKSNNFGVTIYSFAHSSFLFD